jgi:type IV pilus assembly protein PilW
MARSFSTASSVRGFSLVELMVAMTLSLILLGGVLAIFASSKKTYETTDRLSRIQENGRYALDSIVRDLRGAGYLGCMQRAPFKSTLNSTGSLLWNFQFPIQGFDAQGGGWQPALDLGVATGAIPEGDALVIRTPRTEFEPLRIVASMVDTKDPVTIEDLSPALIKAGDIVQASDCGGRTVFQVTANGGGVLQHAITGVNKDLAAAPGNATDDLSYAFSEATPNGKLGGGELVSLRSVVYFLAEKTLGAGTSLYRRVGGSGVAEELVEGVENMQLQFGEDADGDNKVGISEYRRADEVARWDLVLSVRIALLVRSLSEYGTDRDVGTYELLDETVEDPGDRHLRQVFSTTVTIRNASI